jgi:hypothetical protein
LTTQPEQWEAYIQAYRRSRHQGASAALAGIGVATVTRRKREDPEFRERVAAAAMALDGDVQARAISVALGGAPREVLTPAGDVVTLRSYCPKTTLSYLEQYCGWGEQRELDGEAVKQVQLMAGNDQPLGLLDILRSGVEKARGAALEPTNGTANSTNGVDHGSSKN